MNRTALLLHLSLLGACAGDDGNQEPSPAVGDAHFAEADALELELALISGMGLGTAYGLVAAFDIDADAMVDVLDPDAAHCPEFSFEAPSRITYTADGCVGQRTGSTHSGALVLDNMPNTLGFGAAAVGDGAPRRGRPGHRSRHRRRGGVCRRRHRRRGARDLPRPGHVLRAGGGVRRR